MAENPEKQSTRRAGRAEADNTRTEQLNDTTILGSQDADGAAAQQGAMAWRLWDAASVNEWEAPPLAWLAEEIIQSGGIGFLSGPPKVGKSLLALDLCNTLAVGGLWLERYACRPTRILYVAREDPARRLKDRLEEIVTASGIGYPPNGSLTFIIREPLRLNDPKHVEELKRIALENEIELVVFDVLNRMIPGIDENKAEDVGRLVDVIEQLNRTLGVAILAIDHTRKPQSGKPTAVDPFELKGSIAKYGCCDFIICIGRRRNRDIEVYIENKDVDDVQRFAIAVSPKGSTEPKFQWKEDLNGQSANLPMIGQQNRAKVIAAIGREPIGKQAIARTIGLSPSTVGAHLRQLLSEGEIESTGTNKSTQYRAKQPTGLSQPAEVGAVTAELPVT